MKGTIIEFLYNNLEDNSGKTALLFKRDGKYYPTTYSELIQKVEAFALILKEKGINKGDRTTILSKNRPEWVIADFAALSIGAVSVPIYDTLSSETIEYILKDSEAKLIVLEDETQLEKILKIKKDLPNLAHIVVIDSANKPRTAELMEDLISKGMSAPSSTLKKHRKSLEDLTSKDLATIMYTSGTTGLQKGVMLLHSNIVSNCTTALSLVDIRREDVSLSYLPFSHSYARTTEYYGGLKRGLTIAFAESIAKIPENLLEISPTLFFSVPRLFEKVYLKIQQNLGDSIIKEKLFKWAIGVGKEHNLNNKKDLITTIQYKVAEKLVFSKIKAKMGGRIRLCITGGGPIAMEILEFFYSAGILILEGYGLTETSPVLTLNRESAFRFGTVGKPIDGVEVKIAPDGEIIAKGPNIMQGYFKKDKETTDAFTTDGFFRTGDIGEFDKDGFLKITDRKKDILILSTGKNVAPQLVENKLKLSKFVSNVAAVGHGKGYVAALICPNFDILKDWAKENDLIERDNFGIVHNKKTVKLFHAEIDRTNSELSRFEQVKKFKLLPCDFSIENGELTPTLKVKRNVVEKKYSKEITELYAE